MFGDLGFSKVLNAIHAELRPEYELDAVRWCDKNLCNAWSIAQDRFDHALMKAMDTSDAALAEREGEVYKNEILRLIKIYKRETRKDDAKEFLASLSERVS